MYLREQQINFTEIKAEPLLCQIPFNQFLVDEKGDVNLCCGSYIKNMTPVAGNLFEQDALSIWNSEIFKTFRRSFTDGSLRYCNEQNCSVVANKDKPEMREIIHNVDEIKADAKLRNSNFAEYTQNPDNFDGSLAGFPTRLYLGMDQSCNLKCPSCREGIIMEHKSSDRLDRLYANLKSITKGIEFLELDGSGDVLASYWYQKFLKDFPVEDFPKLKNILFRSNGLLWNEKNWLRIHPYFRSKQIHGCVSIDAATGPTFEKVRGGSFTTLMKNMAYIKSLRQSGELSELTLVMVYRHSNYQEIPAFIEMGKQFLATRLVIHPLQAWSQSAYVRQGTYDHEAIHQQQHPEHQLFRDFITQQGIEKSKFVDFLL